MKICCDVCGGTLVVMAGGKGAVCKSCGMEHSIERVREMLAAEEPALQESPAVIIEKAQAPSPIPEPIVQVEEPLVAPETIEAVEPIEVIAPIAEYEIIQQEEVAQEAVVTTEPTVILTPAAAIDPIIIVPPMNEEKEEESAAIFEQTEEADDYPIVVTKIAPQSAVVNAANANSEIPFAKWEPVAAEVKPPLNGKYRSCERACYNPQAEPYLTSSRLQSLPPEYFESLLVYLFPGFEIYKNVQLEYQFQFDFLITKNDKPLVAIIFCHANDYESTEALVVMNYCRKQGIECLRFFTNFANKPDYVYKRINALPVIRRAK